VKSRAGTWVPPSIAPNPSEPFVAEVRADVSSPPESEWSNPVIGDNESESDEWLQALEVDIADFTCVGSLDDPFNLKDS
jgi:hypothetical protein